jgi:hypothetical protein
MSPDMPFAFQEQITTTNNNHTFTHSFENGYLTNVSGVSLLAYGILFDAKEKPL